MQSKLTEYLACERVQHEYSGQLDTDQKRDIADKKNEANAQANAQLISVYNIAMRYSVTDGLEAVELRDFTRDMQTQITEKLLDAIIEEEWLIRSIGIGTLKTNRLYPTIDSPINVTALYEAFLQYGDKPMITGQDAVINSIQKYCYNGEFNVAFGEAGNYSRIYHREDIFGLNVDDRQYWLVDKSVLPKREEPSQTESATTTSGIVSETSPSEGQPSEAPAAVIRKFKSIKVSGKVPVEQWTQLFSSFIVPLNQNNLEIEVSFKAKSTSSKPLDESAQIYKVVKESAQQLGLKLEEE